MRQNLSICVFSMSATCGTRVHEWNVLKWSAWCAWRGAARRAPDLGAAQAGHGRAAPAVQPGGGPRGGRAAGRPLHAERGGPDVRTRRRPGGLHAAGAVGARGAAAPPAVPHCLLPRLCGRARVPLLAQGARAGPARGSCPPRPCTLGAARVRDKLCLAPARCPVAGAPVRPARRHQGRRPLQPVEQVPRARRRCAGGCLRACGRRWPRARWWPSRHTRRRCWAWARPRRSCAACGWRRCRRPGACTSWASGATCRRAHAASVAGACTCVHCVRTCACGTRCAACQEEAVCVHAQTSAILAANTPPRRSRHCPQKGGAVGRLALQYMVSACTERRRLKRRNC